MDSEHVCEEYRLRLTAASLFVLGVLLIGLPRLEWTGWFFDALYAFAAIGFLMIAVAGVVNFLTVRGASRILNPLLHFTLIAIAFLVPLVVGIGLTVLLIDATQEIDVYEDFTSSYWNKYSIYFTFLKGEACAYLMLPLVFSCLLFYHWRSGVFVSVCAVMLAAYLIMCQVSPESWLTREYRSRVGASYYGHVRIKQINPSAWALTYLALAGYAIGGLAVPWLPRLTLTSLEDSKDCGLAAVDGWLGVTQSQRRLEQRLEQRIDQFQGHVDQLENRVRDLEARLRGGP